MEEDDQPLSTLVPTAVTPVKTENGTSNMEEDDQPLTKLVAPPKEKKRK